MQCTVKGEHALRGSCAGLTHELQSEASEAHPPPLLEALLEPLLPPELEPEEPPELPEDPLAPEPPLPPESANPELLVDPDDPPVLVPLEEPPAAPDEPLDPVDPVAPEDEDPPDDPPWPLAPASQSETSLLPRIVLHAQISGAPTARTSAHTGRALTRRPFKGPPRSRRPPDRRGRRRGSHSSER
jgi:hypothetical protein